MVRANTKEASGKETRKQTVLIEIARGRADIYRFFSGFFLEIPTKATIKKIADPKFVEEMTVMFGKRAAGPLVKFVEEYKPAHYDDIRQEYTHLFIIPTEGPYVAPYESVYLTGLMLQQPLVDARRLYKKAGAEFKPSEVGNHEDYLGCELGFMRYLIEEESGAWKRNDHKQALNILRYQVGFVEDHLTQWVDNLCARIEENGSPLFQGIAKTMSRFVNLDYDQAVELLEAVEGEG